MNVEEEIANTQVEIDRLTKKLKRLKEISLPKPGEIWGRLGRSYVIVESMRGLLACGLHGEIWDSNPESRSDPFGTSYNKEFKLEARNIAEFIAKTI